MTIDQTSEAWVIIEARWKDLKFLFLLIMSLISGIELFNEIGYYTSDSFRLIFLLEVLEVEYLISHQIIIGSHNFLNQLIFQHKSSSIRIDGWRPFNLNREISVDKTSTRFVLGLRGTTNNGWDWEAAVTNADAKSVDAAGNRMTYEAVI